MQNRGLRDLETRRRGDGGNDGAGITTCAINIGHGSLSVRHSPELPIAIGTGRRWKIRASDDEVSKGSYPYINWATLANCDIGLMQQTGIPELLAIIYCSWAPIM